MRRNLMRKISVVFVCFILLLTLSPTVFAADSAVTYVTSEKKFTFSPASKDLFQNFKGVMPGDQLSQMFAVINDQKYGVRVNLYLSAKPVAGANKEETEKYNKFLSNLTLSVTEDGKKNPLFENKANEQGTLKDKVLLGTFYPGAKTNFIVNLKVPIEVGNEFQDATGKITWVFTAEESPVPVYPPGVYPPEVKPDNPVITEVIQDEITPLANNKNPPKTGDEANIIIPIILMAMTVVVVVLLFVTRKKKRNNHSNFK